LFVAFRIVLWLTAASFFIPAGLITASLFMTDRAPHSTTFAGVSVVVSLLFLAAGLLILGIQSRITAIAESHNEQDSATNDDLDRHLSSLAVYLMICGIAQCMIMMTVTFAIALRINEGYPVFG
jgi:hypothetical protein